MSESSLTWRFLQAMTDTGTVQPPVAGLEAAQIDGVDLLFSGRAGLPSVFPVTELASASMGAAALSLAQFISYRFGTAPAISIDRRLASFWFASSLRPLDWEIPDIRNVVTGDYATQDGWIRLHANAPRHRDAALKVLGVAQDRPAIEQAVASWKATELETAVVHAGGAAAAMRLQSEWSQHPQGQAVAAEPVFDHQAGSRGVAHDFPATAARPLAGLRVLDLTRVLAGPVSTRFLAGYGAQVLRIDPPFWSEPGLVPEVTLGKRCAYLDFRQPLQLERLKELLAQADVLVHGFRPGALDHWGLGAEARQQLRPGLVDVCLNAYGWTGPWNTRRGFDSLVQMSSGIADTGMRRLGRNKPTPLPVQALDQATGYLMAAAVVRGLLAQARSGYGNTTRLSLARTAALLTQFGASGMPDPLEPESADDYAEAPELTSWGTAVRLRSPCVIAGAPMRWDYAASALGTGESRWLA